MIEFIVLTITGIYLSFTLFVASAYVFFNKDYIGDFPRWIMLIVIDIILCYLVGMTSTCKDKDKDKD